jgi:polynucleotide 5'-kinase involved in rRNA processing
MDLVLFNDSSGFVVLEQEALELAELRQKPGPIIVTGPWGIGKTTLLEYFTAKSISQCHPKPMLLSACVDYPIQDPCK